jgi:hypothetical protein
MKTVLDLDHKDAKNYFLESKNYCNFDLPKYFNFDNVLAKTSKIIGNRNMDSLIRVDSTTRKKIHPGDVEEVNHVILGNKDGEFAWRPYELIHPALYVALVNLITDQPSWNIIKSRFSEFSKSGIVCESIPVVTTTSQTHKAEQVRWWWENIEQESVRQGINYKYVLDVDISNCYPSIYTHSISWALHSKKKGRDDRAKRKLLGSKIDAYIQKMRYRQTNGIPQGNVVSDLIAEMILGYADTLLIEKLNWPRKREFKILRYRDDYKIFTNRPDLNYKILKALSGTLAELGLKINTSKTKINHDPILASFKEDKIDELFVHKKTENYAKWLVQIYATVSKHPNSGKTARQLSTFYDGITELYESKKKLRKCESPEVMLSIICNLAIANPRYYNWCMAIVSVLLSFCSKTDQKLLSNKITNKFSSIPNTGLLDIWLQRAIYNSNPNRKFLEPLTELVTKQRYPGNKIWDSTWLKDELKDIVIGTPIVDKKELDTMKPFITKEETALFKDEYNLI